MASLFRKRKTFEGDVSPFVRVLRVNRITQESAKIPPMFRPSAMYWGGQTDALYGYQQLLGGTSGGLGIIRAEDHYYDTANNYSAGATLSEFLTRAHTYLSLARISAAVARGTVVVYAGPINGTYAASTDPAVYLNNEPDDTSVSGVFESAITNLAQLCCTSDTNIGGAGVNGLGYPIATEIGDPGVMFAGPNEVNASWLGTQGELENTLLAIWRGIQAVDTDCTLVAPSLSGFGAAFLTPTLAAFAANSVNRFVIDFHRFMDDPYDSTEAFGAAAVSALSTAGLPVTTPFVSLEYQNDSDTSLMQRFSEKSAAFLASTLMSHGRAGWSAMAMATLMKQGNAPTDASAYAESGSFAGWGMIPRPTTPSALQAGACPSFMLMSLFSLWSGGVQVEIVPSLIPEFSVESRAFMTSNSLFVLVSRWHDDSASPFTVQIESAESLGALKFSRSASYRFKDGINDPQYTYFNLQGSDSEKADISKARAESPEFDLGYQSVIDITLQPKEAALVQFLYA